MRCRPDRVPRREEHLAFMGQAWTSLIHCPASQPTGPKGTKHCGAWRHRTHPEVLCSCHQGSESSPIHSEGLCGSDMFRHIPPLLDMIGIWRIWSRCLKLYHTPQIIPEQVQLSVTSTWISEPNDSQQNIRSYQDDQWDFVVIALMLCLIGVFSELEKLPQFQSEEPEQVLIRTKGAQMFLLLLTWIIEQKPESTSPPCGPVPAVCLTAADRPAAGLRLRRRTIHPQTVRHVGLTGPANIITEDLLCSSASSIITVTLSSVCWTCTSNSQDKLRRIHKRQIK